MTVYYILLINTYLSMLRPAYGKGQEQADDYNIYF